MKRNRGKQPTPSWEWGSRGLPGRSNCLQTRGRLPQEMPSAALANAYAGAVGRGRRRPRRSGALLPFVGLVHRRLAVGVLQSALEVFASLADHVAAALGLAVRRFIALVRQARLGPVGFSSFISGQGTALGGAAASRGGSGHVRVLEEGSGAFLPVPAATPVPRGRRQKTVRTTTALQTSSSKCRMAAWHPEGTTRGNSVCRNVLTDHVSLKGVPPWPRPKPAPANKCFNC